MDLQQISRELKARFPAYRNMDDVELATLALEKYPEITNGISITSPQPIKNIIAADQSLVNDPLKNLSPDSKINVEQTITPEGIDEARAKNYYDFKYGIDHDPQQLRERVNFEYGEGTSYAQANEQNSVRANSQDPIKPISFGEANAYAKTHTPKAVEFEGYSIKDADVVKVGSNQMLEDQVRGDYTSDKDYTSSIIERLTRDPLGQAKQAFDVWWNYNDRIGEVLAEEDDIKELTLKQAETFGTGVQELFGSSTLGFLELVEGVAIKNGATLEEAENISNTILKILFTTRRFAVPRSVRFVSEKIQPEMTKQELEEQQIALNQLGQTLAEESEEISGRIVPDVDGVDLFKRFFTTGITEDEAEDLGEWIGANVAVQLPQLAVQMGLTATAYLVTKRQKTATAVGGFFMGINSAANSSARLDNDLAKPFENLARPVIDGYIEYYSEKFELDVLTSPFTKKAIRGGLGRYFVNLGKSIATGAGSESLAQVGQNLNAKLFGEDISITSGLGEAALIGAVIDGQIGSVTQAFSIKRTNVVKKRDKKAVKEYNQKASELSKQMSGLFSNKIVYGHFNDQYVALEYDQRGKVVREVRVDDKNELDELKFKRQLIGLKKESNKELFRFEVNQDNEVELTDQIFEVEDLIPYDIPKRPVKLSQEINKAGRLDIQPLYDNSSDKGGRKKLGNLYTNLDTILKTFPKNNRANAVKTIFKKFKKFYPNTMKNTDLYGERGTGAAGYYNQKDVTLDMKYGNTPETLLHETIHALTFPALRASVQKIALDYPQANALLSPMVSGEKLFNIIKDVAQKFPEEIVGQLCQLMAITIEHQGLESYLANRKVAGYGFRGKMAPTTEGVKEQLPYGLSAIFEFVTEAFVDQGFQRELESIKLPNDPDSSVWSQFIEWVSRIFGRLNLTKKENNILMETIGLIEDLSEQTEAIISKEADLDTDISSERIQLNISARRKRLAQATELSNLREIYESMPIAELVEKLKELGVENNSLINDAIENEDSYYLTSVILREELGEIADYSRAKKYEPPVVEAEEISEQVLADKKAGKLVRLTARGYEVLVYKTEEGNFLLPEYITSLKDAKAWLARNADAVSYTDNTTAFNEGVRQQFIERKTEIDQQGIEVEEQRDNTDTAAEEFADRVLERAGAVKEALFFFIPRNLSTRIRELSPQIFLRLMSMHQEERMLLIGYKRAFQPFKKAVKRARRKLDHIKRKELNAAILNGDWSTVQKLGVPQEVISSVIELFADIADKLNMDRNVNYFRRVVADYEGLVKELGRKPNTDVEQAIKAWIKKKKRQPSKKDIEKIIRNLLRDTKKLEATLQTRSVAKVTPELSVFYADPIAYLDSYFARVARLYSRARAFGQPLKSQKRKVTVDGVDVGEFTEIDTDDLDYSNSLVEKIVEEVIEAESIDDVKKVDKLIKLLKSALNYKPASTATSLIRTAASLKFVNQIDTFLIQLIDIPVAMLYNGALSTVKGIATYKKYINEFGEKIKLSMKDAGIEVFDLEFQEGLSKAKFKVRKKFYLNLQNVLKGAFAGLAAFDYTGKRSLYSGTQYAWGEMAQKNPQRLKRKLMLKFQNEAFVDRVVDDIKNDRVTKDTMLAFYLQVAEFHPLTTSDHIKFYIDHPEMRVFLVLTSFAFKMCDRLARQAIEPLVDGVANGMIAMRKTDFRAVSNAGTQIGAGVVGLFQVLVATHLMEEVIRERIKTVYEALGVKLRPQDEEEEKEQSILYQYRRKLLGMNPLINIYEIEKLLKGESTFAKALYGQFRIPEFFGTGIVQSIIKNLTDAEGDLSKYRWSDDSWMKDVPLIGDILAGSAEREEYLRSVPVRPRAERTREREEFDPLRDIERELFE